MRRRLTYLALAVTTILVGLAVHAVHRSHPTPAGDIAGDALWAMMVVWLVSAIVPAARFPTRGSVAFAIAVTVECSQLYHAPGLDALRATLLGHLVLGSGFDPRDFVAYGGGVLAAGLIDRAKATRRRAVR